MLRFVAPSALRNPIVSGALADGYQHNIDNADGAKG